MIKADTSLERAPGVGPCSSSVIFFDSLLARHLFQSQTTELESKFHKEKFSCSESTAFLVHSS